MVRAFLPALVLVLSAIAPSASAQMRITEWQYNGDEFIEFSNVGTSSIDLTGWSFDDDSRLPGTVSLSLFGTLAPGASAILCEASATAFAGSWGLTGVAIAGSNTANLGRNDEINLYDASNQLVDRFAYGDQNFPGTIRTLDISGSPCHSALGQNDAYAWTPAFAGDARGSFLSTGGKLGNPGSYAIIGADFTAYGTSCPGTGNIAPVLDSRGCPTPGGQAILDVQSGAANAPAVLLFGLSRTSIPLGACVLNLAPIPVTVPLLLDAAGATTLSFGVATSVLPATLTTQVLVLDAGAWDGFSATNGLEIAVR